MELKTLETDDLRIFMGNYTYTTIIADFMSVTRKVPLNKFSCIRDALE